MNRLLFYSLLLSITLFSCTKAERLSDVKSEFTTIDDSIKIHYKAWNCEKNGDSRQTICFVHGFGCDLNTWEKQFEALRNESDLQLVFIDLPGYGESSKPHVEYTLGFFAKAVGKVLDDNGIESVTLVGHSLGTPVCRQVFLEGGRNGRLVDIDGVYCFYDGTETVEYVEAVNQFGHAFDEADCRKVIEGFVTSLAGKNTPKEVNDYALSTMPKTPQYVASSTMRNLVERKWWNQNPLEIKTMVICTQNSGLDPDNKAKMQKLYPVLDYTELTDCGHFIHMEQAEMINSKLKEFTK